ncbi:kelch-like protein 2 [Acyrthosiphon pisum]|uniref:BACK domain-containing protein n=1 Tax=Acyrthosiphon pisum TaxID=7029 RepID=A0A8R2NTD8_ACYPI|nr:kelch-like protein 2 [Acyrthosiphon pisum]
MEKKEVVGGKEFLSLSSEQVVKLISNERHPVSSEEISGRNHELRRYGLVTCTQTPARKCYGYKTMRQEVVGGKEFLSLSSEQVVKLISIERLPVSSEEIVFECVIRWVTYDLGSRRCILPQLLEYKIIIMKVIIIYLRHYIQSTQKSLSRKASRIHPDMAKKYDSVILVVGGIESETSNNLEWLDPRPDQWHFGPELITDRCQNSLVVINDNFVFDVGASAIDLAPLRTVYVLDLSSELPCWQQCNDMLVERQFLGVGVINNNIYAVGGYNQSRHAVDTVECYNPSMDMWSPVANLRVCRFCACVEVLNGVLYAVGGHDGSDHLSSVEAYTPSTEVWTSISDILMPQKYAEVALDGLLYVVGGINENSIYDSVECYNPNTNTWAMVTAKWNITRIMPGVVTINRPLHFTTYEHL